MKNFIFIAMATLIIVACKKKKTDPAIRYHMLSGTVEYIELTPGHMLSSPYLNSSDPKIVVVANQSAWEQFVTNIKREKLKNELSIDFQTHQVLGIFDRMQPDSRYTINIVSMVGESNNVVVTTETTFHNGAATTEPAQPYRLVKIPQTQQTFSLVQLPEREIPAPNYD